MPRSYHGEADEDDGLSAMSETTLRPSYASIVRLSKNEDEGAQINGFGGDGNGRHNGGQRLLSQEETTELARRAVENGIQETKRSLAGNEAVSDVVKPKLTIDLGHSNIVRIPEAMVDVIKDEVERCVSQFLLSF